MIVKLKQYQLATTVHSGTDQVIKHAFCQSKTGRKYFNRQHMSDSPLTLFTLQIVQGSVTLTRSIHHGLLSALLLACLWTIRSVLQSKINTSGAYHNNEHKKSCPRCRAVFNVSSGKTAGFVYSLDPDSSGHPRVARGVWDPDYIRIDYASCNRFIV